MKATALLGLLLPVVPGCAEPWASKGQRRAFGAVVENSPSYRRARADGGHRVFWMVEGTNDGYTQIYVGGDMGTHTSRIVTLRVTPDFRVERHSYDSAGEDLWIPDK